MKNSGYSWIGNIPEDWNIFPAKYVFSEIREKNTDGRITNALKFYNGTIIPKTNFDADTDNYVAETISNYTIVSPNTIMINGLNLNYDLKSLRVGLVKEQGVITSAYLALKPNINLILPEFATYLFKGYETTMAFHNMGAGIRKTLGFKEFKNQPILVPNITIQKKIITFLDKQCSEIDAVLTKTKESIEEYKLLKNAIITQAVTKGIRPNRKMKDSGIEWIGEIPEDWKIRKLKSLTSIISKGATPKDINNESSDDYKIRFIKSENIVNNQIASSPNFFITLDANEEQKRSVLLEYDILFVIAGASIGKVAILPKKFDGSNTNQAVSFIRLLQDYKKSVNYVWYFLQSSIITIIIQFYAVQSAQPNLSMEDLGSVRIPFPPISEQEEIVEYLDKKCSEIDKLIEKKEQLISELENYKKSLIYEYVTGKKEVQ